MVATGTPRQSRARPQAALQRDERSSFASWARGMLDPSSITSPLTRASPSGKQKKSYYPCPCFEYLHSNYTYSRCVPGGSERSSVLYVHPTIIVACVAYETYSPTDRKSHTRPNHYKSCGASHTGGGGRWWWCWWWGAGGGAAGDAASSGGSGGGDVGAIGVLLVLALVVQ